MIDDVQNERKNMAVLLLLFRGNLVVYSNNLMLDDHRNEFLALKVGEGTVGNSHFVDLEKNLTINFRGDIQTMNVEQLE